MNARQTAAFWIEHVLKFGGEHLRPSSMDLTWWQFYCLDVLIVLSVGVTAAIVLFYALTKFILKRFFRILSGQNHAKRD